MIQLNRMMARRLRCFEDWTAWRLNGSKYDDSMAPLFHDSIACRIRCPPGGLSKLGRHRGVQGKTGNHQNLPSSGSLSLERSPPSSDIRRLEGVKADFLFFVYYS